MSRLNATTTESVLDNIEVQRALNISYTEGYLDGKKAQKKEDIDKACEWFEKYLFEIGYPDDWVRDSHNMISGKDRFIKAMEDEK